MSETNELTGDEGGSWRVFTQRTIYDFDLDAGTVTRIPGPDSSRTINDDVRHLLEIKACKVGHFGYWTMRPDGADGTIEHFWQLSTKIRRIERLAPPV